MLAQKNRLDASWAVLAASWAVLPRSRGVSGVAQPPQHCKRIDLKGVWRRFGGPPKAHGRGNTIGVDPHTLGSWGSLRVLYEASSLKVGGLEAGSLDPGH